MFDKDDDIMMMEVFSFDDINDEDDDEAIVDVEEPANEEAEDEYFDDEEAEESEEDEELLEDEELPELGEDDPIPFMDLDDDTEFDFGDGLTMTKKDVAEYVKDRSEFSTRKQVLDTYFNTFEEIDNQMNSQFTRLTTENEAKMRIYRKRLETQNLTPHERGLIYDDIAKLEGNQKLLEAEVNVFLETQRKRNEAADIARLDGLNIEMTRRYGKDWVDKMAPSITDYVVANKLGSPEMKRAISPELIEVIIKAQKYDNLKKESATRVKSKVEFTEEGKKARSTASRKNVKSRTKGDAEARRAAALRKAKEGKLSPGEMFRYLED